MRILCEDNNISVKSITILLTFEEAKQFLGDLEFLCDKRRTDIHTHTNDTDYTHEITTALYEPGQANGFDQRVKRLILEDQ